MIARRCSNGALRMSEVQRLKARLKALEYMEWKVLKNIKEMEEVKEELRCKKSSFSASLQ